MQNYYRVGGLTGSNLSIPTGRAKTVYILPSSNSTFVSLLLGFIEYDDDDDDDVVVSAVINGLLPAIMIWFLKNGLN
ncbi:hypothetical protein Hanom_Chr03g00275411 [Helianthus anomalus]